jgi:heterotetrameric sarcosine oxidase gamma subunit
VLEHRAPLHRLAATGRGAPVVRPGLQIAARDGTAFLLVQGEAEDAYLRDAFRDTLGAQLPAPQRGTVVAGSALLWLTPKEWLLMLPAAEATAVHARLTARLVPTLTAITDVSDGFAHIDVSGSLGPEVLMTGCSLNLRPEAFGAGHVARTTLADVPTIIWKPDETPRILCLIDRSWAEHFWRWLADSPVRS